MSSCCDAPFANVEEQVKLLLADGKHVRFDGATMIVDHRKDAGGKWPAQKDVLAAAKAIDEERALRSKASA